MKCLECKEEVGNIGGLFFHYITKIIIGIILGLIIVGIIKIFI